MPSAQFSKNYRNTTNMHITVPKNEKKEKIKRTQIYHKAGTALWSLSRNPSKTTLFLYSREFKSRSPLIFVIAASSFLRALSRGTKYNHADVHKIAHNRPHTNIIIKVTTIIDMPTTGSNLLTTIASSSLLVFLGTTRYFNDNWFARLSRVGTGIETECFNVAAALPVLESVVLAGGGGLGLMTTSGELGWFEDPVLMASIFRRNDNRFRRAAFFEVSAWWWSSDFRFSRVLFCSVPCVVRIRKFIYYTTDIETKILDIINNFFFFTSSIISSFTRVLISWNAIVLVVEFARFVNNLWIFHLGLEEFDDFDEWILISDRSVLLSEEVSKGTVLAEEFFIRNIDQEENKPVVVVVVVSKGTAPLSLSPLLLDSTSSTTTLFTDDIFSENFLSFPETPKQ